MNKYVICDSVEMWEKKMVLSSGITIFGSYNGICSPFQYISIFFHFCPTIVIIDSIDFLFFHFFFISLFSVYLPRLLHFPLPFLLFFFSFCLLLSIFLRSTNYSDTHYKGRMYKKNDFIFDENTADAVYCKHINHQRFSVRTIMCVAKNNSYSTFISTRIISGSLTTNI